MFEVNVFKVKGFYYIQGVKYIYYKVIDQLNYQFSDTIPDVV